MFMPLCPTRPDSVEFPKSLEIINFFDGGDIGDTHLVYSVVTTTGTDSTRVLAAFARANWAEVHEDMEMPESDEGVTEAFYAADGNGIYWKSEEIGMTSEAVQALVRSAPAF